MSEQDMQQLEAYLLHELSSEKRNNIQQLIATDQNWASSYEEVINRIVLLNFV